MRPTVFLAIANTPRPSPTTSAAIPDADGDGKTELVQTVLATGSGEPRKFARIGVTLP